MPGAGDLRDRVRFEQKAEDNRGDRVGAWEPLPSAAPDGAVAAGIRYLRGSEPVVAARLQGKQPAVVTVRASSHTRQITAAFRAVNARTGKVFDIKAVTPTDDRAWIDFLTEADDG